MDVVVVGPGAAGLVCALVAAVGGLRVLVVEKSEKLGGTSAMSGARSGCPPTIMARPRGCRTTRWRRSPICAPPAFLEHRGSAKALTRQRLPSRVIANATQEFVKPRCRMVGDAAQHVGEPSLPSDEPSSARARRDGPSGFKVLRTRSEHVPSRSRTLPKAAGKSNFSRSRSVLGPPKTSCRHDVSCLN